MVVKPKNAIRHFIFLLCALYFNTLYAISIEPTLSQNQIHLDETFSVTFSIDNISNLTRPDFSPLERDFHILGTSYGTAMKMINGVTQAQILWQLTLAPKRVGELWIPEIDFGEAKSLPSKISVTKAPISPSNNYNKSDAFVTAELNTTTPYLQSQAIYTFKLFYRTRLANPIIEPPIIDHGQLTPIGDDKHYQTIIKGTPYLVYEKHFVLSPQKAGKVTIPPMKLHAQQIDFDYNNFASPFSMASNKPIALSTQGFELHVRNIPNEYPAKDWLPATNINLTENWSADFQHWQVGTPITRTITIKAQGLRSDQIPDLNLHPISGLKSYPETPRREDSFAGNTVVGSWSQKIAYIPDGAQIVNLPSVELTWWNTQKKQLEIAKLPSKEIQILNNSKFSNTSLLDTQDTNPIKQISAPTSKSVAIQNQTKVQMNKLQIIKSQELWFWIAIFFIVVWVMTVILALRLRVNNKVGLKIRSMSKADNKIEKQGNFSFSERSLLKACQANDAEQAAQLLLAWAKSHYNASPHSLGKLQKLIADAHFKTQILLLEYTRYSSNPREWHGAELFSAYKKFIRQEGKQQSKFYRKCFAKPKKDPLPSLYPE